MSNPILPSEDAATSPDALTIPDLQEAPPPPFHLPSPDGDADDLVYIDTDDADGVAAPFVVSPFQMSNGMPTVPSGNEQTPSAAPPPGSPPGQATPRRRRLPLPLVVLLISVVVILAMLGMNAFAQTGSFQHPGTAMTGAPATPLPTPRPSQGAQPPALAGKPTPPAMPSPQPPGQGLPAVDWVPAELPAGWMAAGLTMSDALEAERTAFSFTDREMSLDYRSIGTRIQHGGTMTAATFLLTPAAKVRFLHNDVRMINNTLFDQVRSTRLIRTVIDASPSLVQYATQGQQQFAWVDVSFSYWMSQVDPATGTQMDGRDIDPGSGQPRVHHLIVLLLRIPPTAQGTNPAMGGTGWLVSTYALDQPVGTLPAIVQPA